jgi:hypothetical protein
MMLNVAPIDSCSRAQVHVHLCTCANIGTAVDVGSSSEVDSEKDVDSDEEDKPTQS